MREKGDDEMGKMPKGRLPKLGLSIALIPLPFGQEEGHAQEPGLGDVDGDTLTVGMQRSANQCDVVVDIRHGTAPEVTIRVLQKVIAMFERYGYRPMKVKEGYYAELVDGEIVENVLTHCTDPDVPPEERFPLPEEGQRDEADDD